MSADNEQVTRTAGIVGVATLASRILGAVRDMIIASVFGAGLVSDAFLAAFRLPNLFRRLFGEGSLSIAFVPVFTDCLVHQGRSEAQRLAAIALGFAALVLAGVTAAGMFFAPQIVQFMAPGFSDLTDKFALTVQLTRIMMPYLFFIGIVALCMGMLNVYGHFAAPAVAPVVLNLSMILSVMAAVRISGSGPFQAKWLAVGVVIGGVFQLGMQLPFLLKHHIRFWHPEGVWHPQIKKFLLLLGPSLFGAAVYQINSLVITLLATLLPQGSVSYLYYADRLVQFPLGVFAIATATAVLPTLSRQACARHWEALRATFAHALRLVFFITLPSMAGLIVLRRPIVALLFQRGAFDQLTTRLTADALLYYGIGLWSFSAVRIVLNLFFAVKDTHTPLKMGLIAIGANLLLGVVLMGKMGHAGLALALSVASMIHLGLLVWVLRRKMGALGWRAMAASIGKSGLCAAVMGTIIWALSKWLLPAGGDNSWHLLAGVAVCMAAGTIIFAMLAYTLRLPELWDVWRMASKRSK